MEDYGNRHPDENKRTVAVWGHATSKSFFLTPKLEKVNTLYFSEKCYDRDSRCYVREYEQYFQIPLKYLKINIDDKIFQEKCAFYNKRTLGASTDLKKNK